ncbi:MAG: hypothetical protein KGZ86_00985 [Candidatus Latescibacteria bacterium]|nr:hypothetical protein [Candidatus Latescibacterota bacterium]
MAKEKSTRGNASQFFVAGELCRRGYSAVITMGNTPNTDILCSNIEGTRFVHIQVKTFVPGGRTCSVGMKSEKNFGENFFWVLGGIPEPESESDFVYYIIPSPVMAREISRAHRAWLDAPGKKGQEHNDSKVRTVTLPPYKSFTGWDVSEYRNRWDLIEKKLGQP